jgi:hypothetical protein
MLRAELLAGHVNDLALKFHSYREHLFALWLLLAARARAFGSAALLGACGEA